MFVTKKKYDKLYENYMDMVDKYDETLINLKRTTEEVMNRRQGDEWNQGVIDGLEAELETLKSTYADHNTITLTVRDDLTQVTPSVKVKPEVFDKMVELGYMDDHVTSETKSHLMQTAMLVIGAEALEQIVESMSQPINED